MRFTRLTILVLMCSAAAFGQAAGNPVYEPLPAGNGLVSGVGSLAIDLLDAADGTGATSANSGLEFGGAGSDELALLQGCANNEILKWNDSTNVWACSTDVGTNPISGFDTPTELTIATGAVTSTCAANSLCHYTIDTEADAASDDLTTVNCTAGSLLVISANNDARSVVVQAQGNVDFTMDNVFDRMFLHCDATNSVEEITRASGGN